MAGADGHIPFVQDNHSDQRFAAGAPIDEADPLIAELYVESGLRVVADVFADSAPYRVRLKIGDLRG